MKLLSQLQYEVIFLYSKGLTFKEIDKALTTASRGVYSQVVVKDKGRITRAKKGRRTNLNSYKIELNKYIKEVKKNNNQCKDYTQWVKEKYLIPIEVAKVLFRKKYLENCLNKSYRSYCKYKITNLKNIDKKKG
ncbi:hypothetical protein ACOTVT_08740 [Aliarcobacter butzleri]